MTMVGDMFNSGLQATVSGLCAELSSLLATQQVFVPLPPTHTGGGSMLLRERVVAGGAGKPELERRAERRSLRLLSRYAAAGHRPQRPDHGLQHLGSQHRRRAAAAGRAVRLAVVQQSVRNLRRGELADREPGAAGPAVREPPAPPWQPPSAPSPPPQSPMGSSPHLRLRRRPRLSGLPSLRRRSCRRSSVWGSSISRACCPRASSRPRRPTSSRASDSDRARG